MKALYAFGSETIETHVMVPKLTEAQKARQYLFNRGRDWWLLKPSVRAVWLALRAMR